MTYQGLTACQLVTGLGLQPKAPDAHLHTWCTGLFAYHHGGFLFLLCVVLSLPVKQDWSCGCLSGSLWAFIPAVWHAFKLPSLNHPEDMPRDRNWVPSLILACVGPKASFSVSQGNKKWDIWSHGIYRAMKRLGPEEYREKRQVCGTDDLVNELASWL